MDPEGQRWTIGTKYEDGPNEKEKSICNKICNKKKSFIYKLCKPFIVAGERKVKRAKLTAQDFTLPDESWVAEYEPELVADFWNTRNLPTGLCKAIAKRLTRGIYVKLVPILILYLVSYYVLNVFVFNKSLCKEKNTASTDGGNTTMAKKEAGYVGLALAGKNYTCNKAKLESWMKMEKDFTRILTFFIGFIVSMSVRTWFQQVKMVPQLDTILIQINNFIWIDPYKDSNAFTVKMGMSPNDFRKTIIRYFLLSWTMCFSRICVRMNDVFENEGALLRKKLLYKREFDELSFGADNNLSKNWREKWSSPLSWIAKMVNDPMLKDKEIAESVKILDIKDAIGKSLNAYCQDLQKLTKFDQYRIPSPLLVLLTIAIYAFLIVNVAAGQDMYPEQYDKRQWFRFIFDFPWFAMGKYLLIFGWLQVASDLMVPFGKGRYLIFLNFKRKGYDKCRLMLAKFREFFFHSVESMSTWLGFLTTKSGKPLTCWHKVCHCKSKLKEEIQEGSGQPGSIQLTGNKLKIQSI